MHENACKNIKKIVYIVRKNSLFDGKKYNLLNFKTL